MAFWPHKKVGTVTVGVFADILVQRYGYFFNRSSIFLTAVVFFESWNDINILIPTRVTKYRKIWEVQKVNTVKVSIFGHFKVGNSCSWCFLLYRKVETVEVDQKWPQLK